MEGGVFRTKRGVFRISMKKPPKTSHHPAYYKGRMKNNTHKNTPNNRGTTSQYPSRHHL
jgi:hypothetical protein